MGVIYPYPCEIQVPKHLLMYTSRYH